MRTGADEGIVPLLGLSKRPREIPPAVHLYSLTGHWAYGAVLECMRRSVNGTRQTA